MLKKNRQRIVRNFFGTRTAWRTLKLGTFSAVHVLVGILFVLLVAQAVHSQEPLIKPGDELYISVLGQRNLNGTITVSPDGTVMLPQPYGSIKVAGLSIPKVTERLKHYLKDYIKNPVITIYPWSSGGDYVHIVGEVNLPAFHQVPDNSSVQELVTRAGGFTRLANKKAIRLIRKKEKGVEERKIDLTVFMRTGDMEYNPTLEAGDLVVVPRMSEEERARQQVTLIGEVAEPGSYTLETPIPLIDILTLAGGLSKAADLRKISISGRSDEGKSISRTVDLESMLIGDTDSEGSLPVVFPGEVVFIRSMRSERKLSINIMGEVNKPSSYNVRENARLMDVIAAAGGFTGKAAINKTTIVRARHSSPTISTASLKDYILDGDTEENPILRDGDSVIIPSTGTDNMLAAVQKVLSPDITVTVVGGVKKPGEYDAPSDSNLWDIIALAEGPAAKADLARTVIFRNNVKQQELQRIEFDLETLVHKGGDPSLLPLMYSDDTVYIPMEKEKSVYRKALSAARDVLTVVAIFAVTDYYLREREW